MRVPFETMKAEIKRVLLKAGMTEGKADACARVHTESSRDGVYSHGLNRVARFVDHIQKGWVDVNAEPSLIKQSGMFENYDGNLGPGVLNALFSINRATEVAKEQGIGIVALRNTNHWMRGGTYAWEAAEKGYIGICWTNTESCMPAWGAKNTCLGNNPLCIAIPREKGPIVLDMAMSQYSNGKLQVTRLKNESLPFPGGFDKEGNLTSNPGLIEESQRPLPAGYWKGSGLAMVLDLVVAILSNGLATAGIDKLSKGGSCVGCSQIFIAINPYLAGGKEFVERTLNETIAQIKSAEPVKEGGAIYFPGELAAKTRKENTEQGIPVDEGIWNELLRL
ncbi:MAG TPA: 3-dehydro-L-gulonate 2-dehydrogenase [Firmicutes bacterium]|jgi:3-dehydro-L-gulonate 2-dehydrogenase|nr:3-dehydro-L-gulonate 2-dehydrogenase [Bacillota bacterium]